MMLYYILIALTVLSAIAWMCDWETTGFLAVVGIIVTLITMYETSDVAKERQREAEEEARRQATPHVIREADGCKVYAFTTDREHYFTRCGSTVTTETNWSKSCGKNCTKQESNTITTEGNK